MDLFLVHLPIAQIDFNILVLILVGFFVGVLGGFFGVGGGWIVTPALNSFGFHMAYAIGTDISQIFATSIVGTRKHSKLGNVDWKLGFISVIGSVIGVELGAQTVMLLERYNEAGPVIRITYLFFLLGLGIYMFYDYFIIRKRILKKEADLNNKIADLNDTSEQVSPLAKKVQSLVIPPMISFKTSDIKAVSLWVILAIFLFSGFLSGILGVGGGFIIMPCLVYVVGCPTIIAVGTSLMSVGLTAAYGTFTYAMKGRVELFAAIYMFIGASVGTQFGVAAVRYIKGYGIRILFAIMIILAGCSVLFKQLYASINHDVLRILSEYIVMVSAGFMSFLILIKSYMAFRKAHER